MAENKALKIMTRDFGEQEILEDDILSFPEGIFAFEDVKRFVLLSPMGEHEAPMWLQNVDAPTPCFIVFKSDELVSNYEPQPNKEDLDGLELDDNSTLSYLSIAVIPENHLESTINLKSPIVVNRDKKRAKQIILPQEYDIRFPLFKSEEEA